MPGISVTHVDGTDSGLEVKVLGFPGGSGSKEPAHNAGDTGDSLIPGLGRSLGEGTGKPLQYSCLGNSMPKEAAGLQSMGSQRVRIDRLSLSLLYCTQGYKAHKGTATCREGKHVTVNTRHAS